MHYHFILSLSLFLLFASNAQAQDCANINSKNRMQNKKTKEVHTVYKGETVYVVDDTTKKLALIKMGNHEYRIYKKRLSSEALDCPKTIDNCLQAKQTMTLRNAPGKKHEKISISPDQKLTIASTIKRKKNDYFRLSVSEDSFVWISSKQKDRLFLSCDESSNETDLAQSSDIEDDIEASTEIPEPDTSNAIEAEASTKTGFQTYYGVQLSYGLQIPADFLSPFITSISDPNDVKADPDPIIQSTENGTGLAFGLSYKRNIFSNKIVLGFGLGYEQNIFTLKGKSNPSTASTIVRLRDLNDFEVELEASYINLSSSLAYKVYSHKLVQVLLGLGLGADYSLTENLIIPTRIGLTKTTASESKLTLQVLSGVASPHIELWSNFGLLTGLQYKYVFGQGGHIGAYLGYKRSF